MPDQRADSDVTCICGGRVFADPDCASYGHIALVPTLQAENAELKRQLRFANQNNHKRNVELDALHYVWCDGGCRGGVHRFGDHDRPLTEEMVLAAERNTIRLRRWYNAARHRKDNGVKWAHDKAVPSESASTGRKRWPWSRPYGPGHLSDQEERG